MINQPMKTVAVSRFLYAKTHLDLARLYTESMEVQVNVAREGGKLVDAGDLKGRGYNAYTDGMTVWKPFRIPLKAKTEPEYNDNPISYSLEKYADGVGMTGWDWKARCSRWVAFDFDAILGHSDRHGKKLNDIQLQEIQDIVQNVPFVTLRKSTSGKGLHIYIFMEPVSTQNHTEHAALARSILSMLSGLTGFDFASKVDICGGNMWVWHRKMTPENKGLSLLKQGTLLKTVPANWRDHMVVARRQSAKAMPNFIHDSEDEAFAELTGQRTQVQLDVGHRALIEWLANNGSTWWWDQDAHMLVTHTTALKEAHTALKMCGDFETEAVGTERGADHNCFLFPLRNSGWTVRRYSPGVKEHESWEQDGAGWTRCFFNRKPDFVSLARVNGGVEHEKGGHHFRHAEAAARVLLAFNIDLKLPNFILSRKCIIKPSKEGKITIHIESEDSDDGTKMKGWLNEKKFWRRVWNAKLPNNPESEHADNYDDVLRHIVSNESDAGWVLKRDGGWSEEPLVHIRAALGTLGEDGKDASMIIGASVLKAWTLVNKPFQPEYPGNREWNRNAAQFAVAPTLDIDNLSYPHWSMILNHLGTHLTEAVLKDEWCRNVGINNGAEYLMLWIASMFRRSDQPSAYLSFYGDQDSGKSIFHEAIGEILVTKGVMRADNALQSGQNFNGELENAILAVVEETDLRGNKVAANRIKDWVTSPYIMIRPLYCQGYMVQNCLKWVQCSNEPEETPVFPGDTRITMIYVPPIPKEKMIPKLELKARLRKEAPDFLAAVLAMELPVSNSRLAVPMIETEHKREAMDKNLSTLERFIKEECYETPGRCISAEDFHDALHLWLGTSDEKKIWSQNKIGRELSTRFPRGRLNQNNQKIHYGNLTTDGDALPSAPYYKQNHYLKQDFHANDRSNRPPEERGEGSVRDDVPGHPPG